MARTLTTVLGLATVLIGADLYAKTPGADGVAEDDVV